MKENRRVELRPFAAEREREAREMKDTAKAKGSVRTTPLAQSATTVSIRDAGS